MGPVLKSHDQKLFANTNCNAVTYKYCVLTGQMIHHNWISFRKILHRQLLKKKLNEESRS